MRWDDFRRSDNVEDDRGGGGGFGGGGGGGIGIPGGGLGIGTVIVLALVGWALGIDPRLLIGGADPPDVAAQLNLSVHTVRSHVKSVFVKVGVSSRAELTAALAAR